jgi:hypothetical protein
MADLTSARKSNNDHRRGAFLPAGADGFAVAEAVQRSGRIRPEGGQPEGPGRVRGAASGSPSGDLRHVSAPPAAEVSPAQPALDNTAKLRNALVRHHVQKERQEHRWAMLRGLRRFSTKKRCRECKTPIGRSRVGMVNGESAGHYSGLQSCGNVWVCPVCTAKIREGRRADVMTALDIHTLLNGGGLVFLTLTLPHTAGDRLAELVALLSEAWTYVTRQRGFKAWRERAGLVGNIAALEVTYGENGWHPHRHIMLLTDRQLSADEVAAWEAELHALYNRLLAKKGWKATKEHVGVRMEYVKDPTDSRKLAKYVTKMQAGFELTRSDLKKSRAADGKGDMPFDLLERAIAGDETAKRLWQEYEQAMTGKSSVRFSKGLRNHLGMDAALTDEELAEQEVGGEPELYLEPKLYRRVLRDGQAVKLLRHLECGAAVGVLRALRKLYGDQIEAAEQPGLGLVVDLGRAGP